MPAVPEDLVKVSIRGVLFTPTGPNEEFQHGFYLHLDSPGIDPAFDWQAATEEVAELVRDKWAAAFPTAQSSFASSVEYSEVRAYHLNSDNGTMLHKGQASFEAGDLRGSGTTSTPHECALATTLVAYPLGTMAGDAARRRRGRMYLPAPSGGSVDLYGQLTDAKRATLLGWLDTFFEDVQGMHVTVGTEPDDHWDVVVVSRAANAFHQVEHIGLGKVIDSQRRRRHKELEQYAFTDLSHE